jgi:carboxyl-terminal processing protease
MHVSNRRSGTATRLLAALMLVVALGIGATLASPARAEVPAQNAAVFDEAWRLVRDNFYDRTLKGLDWDKVGDAHRRDYLAASTDKERSGAINAMLKELGASHMLHATTADPAYYQLTDIFSWGLRNDLPRYFPDGKVSYPGIGIFTRDVDGKAFVSGLLAGLPGDKGGLKVGDELISVDGKPFEPVASFREKTGRSVSISVRREPQGPEISLTVTPEQLAPGKAFEAAIRDGARIIEAGGRRIGYIRIWSYASQRYQGALEDELSTGKLKDADALIWDLRDGWGGAQAEYLDIFNPRGPEMKLTDRDGSASVAAFKWRKPVALLINGGTRSGKEVLTYGFKKYGYGEVVGERTAGALLAGRGFLLSDGSFLMVAVNDVSVDGERLEGKGVEPSIEVPFELPYAGGRDPQLDKAVEVLVAAPRG